MQDIHFLMGMRNMVYNIWSRALEFRLVRPTLQLCIRKSFRTFEIMH